MTENKIGISIFFFSLFIFGSSLDYTFFLYKNHVFSAQPGERDRDNYSQSTTMFLNFQKISGWCSYKLGSYKKNVGRINGRWALFFGFLLVFLLQRWVGCSSHLGADTRDKTIRIRIVDLSILTEDSSHIFSIPPRLFSCLTKIPATIFTLRPPSVWN